MSNVAQRISGTFLTTAGVYAIAALTGALAARLLGAEGRGTLAAIQLWPGALATMAMVGLPDAIVYFGAREPGRAAQWLFTAQVIALAAACAAGCIGYPIVSAALRGYDPTVVWTAHLYLLLIPIIVLIDLPFHLTRALGLFGLWNLLRFLPGLGWLAILLASFQNPSNSPETVALAYLGFMGTQAIVITGVCVRVFSGRPWFDRSVAMKLMKYGVPSGLSAVPQLLNLRLDQLLIAMFLSPTQLGLYVVAASWSGISGLARGSIGPVLFQRIATEHDVTQARALFVQATRAAVILSSGTAVALVFVTPLAIPVLYGSGFRASVPAAVILVGASAIAMTNGVVEDGLRGLGDTRAILNAELIGLAGTAVTLALLLGALGIIGAAVASIVGCSAVTIRLAVALRRHDVMLPDAFRPRFADFKNIIRLTRASWPAHWPFGSSQAIQRTL